MRLRTTLVVWALGCGSDGASPLDGRTSAADAKNSPDTAASPDASLANLEYGGELYLALSSDVGSSVRSMYGFAGFYERYSGVHPPFATTRTADDMCPPLIGDPIEKPPVDAGAPADAGIDAPPDLAKTFGPQIFATAGDTRLVYELDTELNSYLTDLTTSPQILDYMGGPGVIEVPGTAEVQSASLPFTLPNPGLLTVEPTAATGEDLVFAWTPTGANTVNINIIAVNSATLDWYGFCSCDFVDDGSATMPWEGCFGKPWPGFFENADLLLATVQRSYEFDVELDGKWVEIEPEVGDTFNLPITLNPEKRTSRAAPALRPVRRPDGTVTLVRSAR
jgi:hypothetical protein